MIPEIAIIGHPNEGKSSVLSTLAEDDSVKISPYPGETSVCRTFPVLIDNREILRFVDTPGFQNPARVLAKLKTLKGSSATRLRDLVHFCGSTENLKEDHELLKPIEAGAAIIYVVNGARPIRRVDRDEMEIIRLIGKPRLAVLNNKEAESAFVQQWKDELARHFNSIRLFDAHRATYSERIDLLEALKSIDQDWQPIMGEVIETIRKDWDNRILTSAHIITSQLNESLSLKLSTDVKPGLGSGQVKEKLTRRYTDKIELLEKRAHKRIRTLFNHNLYDYQLPPQSILHEDIFSEKTWKFMGLSTRQFVLLGGIGGGAVGAGVDVAALGHGLGLFTALGTIGGALGAFGSRKHLDIQTSILGITISGPELTIGPAGSISLLFILINRSLHFFKHMANWSHGRRDHENFNDTGAITEPLNYTSSWPASTLKSCNDFFTSVEQPDSEKHQSAQARLEAKLSESLTDVSSD